MIVQDLSDFLWRLPESNFWVCEVRFVGSQCLLFLFQAISAIALVERGLLRIAMYCVTYADLLCAAL
jgi:hypothetical protein